MTKKAEQIYQKIHRRFLQILEKYQVDTSQSVVTSRSLSPEEAIGITERKDYPILTGKEIMLQTEYMGFFGQAFTDAPAEIHTSLSEILSLDIIHDAHARGLYLSTLNAVMKHLGLVENTVHCKSCEPADCAPLTVRYLKEHYTPSKIALIGYQPSLYKALSEESCWQVRCLDLNPDNIGQERFGSVVAHGIDDYDELVLHWADLILCTSSVFCNATMDRYIDIGKEVLFFGITGAGAISLLGLNRHCPLSK